MAYKWPDKDPDETLDYSVDWSRFLGEDNVAAATWSIINENDEKVEISPGEVVNGLQLVSSTTLNGVVTALIALGTNNKRYKLSCKIVTGNTLTYERDVFLRVKEK